MQRKYYVSSGNYVIANFKTLEMLECSMKDASDVVDTTPANHCAGTGGNDVFLLFVKSRSRPTCFAI